MVCKIHIERLTKITWSVSFRIQRCQMPDEDSTYFHGRRKVVRLGAVLAMARACTAAAARMPSRPGPGPRARARTAAVFARRAAAHVRHRAVVRTHSGAVIGRLPDVRTAVA
jgi:hypothetical protein